MSTPSAAPQVSREPTLVESSPSELGRLSAPRFSATEMRPRRYSPMRRPPKVTLSSAMKWPPAPAYCPTGTVTNALAPRPTPVSPEPAMRTFASMRGSPSPPALWDWMSPAESTTGRALLWSVAWPDS